MVLIEQKLVTKKLRQHIEDGFKEQAIDMLGREGIGDPTSFVASEGPSFAGVVVLQVIWGALHIKHLYVEKPYRGNGLGTQLTNHALSYAQGLACPAAFVETMSYQALGFYKKFGFYLEFSRTGYSQGIALHFLKKNL